MFGSRDGTRIPATSPQGASGGINSDGSVSYSDGTRVEHNDDTGETRITFPDGHVETRQRGDGTSNPDYNPELGVSPDNDPGHAPPPRYDAEQDAYIYGDNTGVKASHNGQRGAVQDNGDILYGDGTRYSHDAGTGRTVVTHADGSTDVYDNQRQHSQDGPGIHHGHLHTGPGVDTTASDDGGTDVHDRQTGTTAHFGGGWVAGAGMGSAKYDNKTDTFDFGDGTHVPASHNGVAGKINGDGSVEYSDGTRVEHNNASGETRITHPDGSVSYQHRGDGEPVDDDSGSDGNDDSGGSSGDDSGSSDDRNDDSADDSTDEEADSSDDSGSDDSSEDSGSDADSEDSDSEDDGASDESRAGFEGGRGSDGGPSATGVVDDRVARMKGEKRDPESPDDAGPGNGGSAPDKVSQPGPGGGSGDSPLARPSADGHQSPVAGVVVPDVKTPSSVGGGDCFKPDGCDNTPTGGFRLDPFNRDPATNPGGGG